ncbi:large ribosomal subunit protein mL54 [Bacillus rossius redtenbacheri]|uniref:large ribosomal subunit protein mL54 n=1 Tax=Bacillus rossius redtenbacheri TaxID=93214 RepID=UPI002FDF0570
MIKNIINGSLCITYCRTCVLLRTFAKSTDTIGIASLGKSKKKLGKIGPMVEKKVLPVETDPHKLANFVCGSNLMKEGCDIPIKPDSEYPDWLWSLNTGKPLPLEELEPDSKLYWRRLRKMALRNNSAKKKLKPF